MNPRLPRLFLVTIVLILGILPWPAAVLAEDAAPAKDQPAPETTLREQDIYIPYAKLREVFEKHGRGVFLPYEKFEELWKAAQDKTAAPPEHKPPVGALITEIENEATVAKDVVQVKALLKIEVLAEGWKEIPLRLADAAITAATVGGKPARIVGGAGQDYKLLVEKQGKAPEQIELSLEYAAAIARAPGQNSVSFQAPQAPVSRWRIRIPQAGVKVNVQPLIAATEVPAAAKPEEKAPEETVILAFVGAAPTVRIEWTPKAEGATGMEALASVQAEQQVTLSEGATRTRAKLTYTISRAELGRLVIDVPVDQKVVNVFDPNVRQWSVEDADGRRKITAQLFDPAKTVQEIVVELEKFADAAQPPKPADVLQVPVVAAVGVGRQQGVIVVEVAQGLRAEVSKTSGLLQVDAAELPESLARGNWAFAYRYAAVPVELALSVEKVEPRVLVDSLVEVCLEPERLGMDLLAIYTIERSGVFRLELDVPEGFEVRQVSGREAAGAAAVQVDAYNLEGEKKTRLIVNLARKAMGRVALAVALQKDLQEPDLLTPTGKKLSVPLVIPRVVPGTPRIVEQQNGRLVLHAPDCLEVVTEKTAGLREISLEEAMQGMEPARQQKPAGVRPILERAFTQEPVTLMVSAKRRQPQVTVRQLLVARIDSGVVKYEATFFYNVLYSGIKSLRINVPIPPADRPGVPAQRWRNVTEGITDTVYNPPPDKPQPPEGYEAWGLAGKTELIGEGSIKLQWEDRLEKLGIGKSVERAVPRLLPTEVDRAEGQIVLAKAETVDVQEKEESPALVPIDPQTDLIAPVAGAARAFAFHEDWKLNIVVTQYKLEEVKRTSVERAVVRMVVTRAGQVPVQALYRMRSAWQRLEVELPDGVQFDTEPARINGRPVTLESKDGKYFVPLVESSADKPFLLELRYTIPGDGSRLGPPVFPERPAVQKLFLCVYLPQELVLLGTQGPWSEEFRWWLDPALKWRPVADPGTDDGLIGELRAGIEMGDSATDTFQTDGRRYVFSTLRPAPRPEGDLQLRKMNERALGAIVFAVVFIGGLLLLPARLGNKALAVGVLVVALVLCGVFLPTLSLMILDSVFVSAVFVVAVIWTVWYLVRMRPRADVAAVAASPFESRPEVPAPPASFKTPSQHGPELHSAGPAPAIETPPPADTATPEPPAAPPPAESPREDRPDTHREKGGPTNA